MWRVLSILKSIGSKSHRENGHRVCLLHEILQVETIKNERLQINYLPKCKTIPSFL